MLPEPETCADRLELRSTNRLWPFGQPSSQRNLVTGPRGGYLPPLAAETSYQPLKVAEMLWVVSAIVMSENTTVIGGLHSGLNVAVAVSVNSACPFCTGKSLAAETLVLCWRRPDMAAGLDALGRRAQDNVNLILVPKAGFLARDRDRIARRCHGERPLDEVRRSRECDGRSAATALTIAAAHLAPPTMISLSACPPFSPQISVRSTRLAGKTTPRPPRDLIAFAVCGQAVAFGTPSTDVMTRRT
jgi:hypothetical protein